MKIRNLNLVVLLTVLIFNCINTSNIASVRISSDNIFNQKLTVNDSILFNNPVMNFCLENNRHLFILDANLEKIYRINLTNFASIETISLPQKISFLNGIASDGIYIYLYTENSLYRFDKLRGQIASLISAQDRIKIGDLSVSQQGEVFVSDELNNQIIYTNTLGKVQPFNRTLKTLFRPGGIFFDNLSNLLWIVNRAQQQVEVYLQNGNVEKILKLPNAQFSRAYVDKQDIYIFNRINGQINQIRNYSMIEYAITKQMNTLNFLVKDDFMLILKSNGLFIYQLNK